MKKRTALLHLLAGGPGSDAIRTQRLLAQALRAADAVGAMVAYVGAASGDNPEFYRRMAGLLRAAGAGDVVMAPTARGARDGAEARRVLERADVIFMSGGDVEAGMRSLAAAGLVSELQQAFRSGTPFIGLSAGSIMIGRAWLAWGDPDDDATAAPFDCLGLAPFVCDTHGEAENWRELHALLARMPEGTRGYAISSGTMLCVDTAGKITEVGG